MTVRLTTDGEIRLEGICPIDDAEPLLSFLSNNRGARVDWRGCEQAHGAVIQLLLAAAPPMIGPPTNGFLQAHVAPLLAAGVAAGEAAARPASPPKRNR